MLLQPEFSGYIMPYIESKNRVVLQPQLSLENPKTKAGIIFTTSGNAYLADGERIWGRDVISSPMKVKVAYIRNHPYSFFSTRNIADSWVNALRYAINTKNFPVKIGFGSRTYHCVKCKNPGGWRAISSGRRFDRQHGYIPPRRIYAFCEACTLAELPDNSNKRMTCRICYETKPEYILYQETRNLKGKHNGQATFSVCVHDKCRHSLDRYLKHKKTPRWHPLPDHVEIII